MQDISPEDLFPPVSFTINDRADEDMPYTAPPKEEETKVSTQSNVAFTSANLNIRENSTFLHLKGCVPEQCRSVVVISPAPGKICTFSD